jgi:hypothetical protein
MSFRDGSIEPFKIPRRLSHRDVMPGLYQHKRRAETLKERNEMFKEAKAMISNGIRSPDAAEPSGTRVTRERDHRLRLLLVMAQGSAGAVPEAWRSYARIEDARASALRALRNPQVLRVAIVEDNNPLRLVEWVG